MWGSRRRSTGRSPGSSANRTRGCKPAGGAKIRLASMPRPPARVVFPSRRKTWWPTAFDNEGAAEGAARRRARALDRTSSDRPRSSSRSSVIFALWLVLAPWPAGFEDVFGKKRLFINALFNGITLGGLYFLVATGFTLIFGLMRNVNLAHGSLYLFGGYMGYEAGELTGSWLLSYVVAFISLRHCRHGHAVFHLPPDGGAGSAPDAGDARTVDHLLRSDGLGLGRQRHSDRYAGLFVGADADTHRGCGSSRAAKRCSCNIRACGW